LNSAGRGPTKLMSPFKTLHNWVTRPGWTCAGRSRWASSTPQDPAEDASPPLACRPHAAELRHAENPVVTPYAVGPVKHRPRRSGPNQDSHNEDGKASTNATAPHNNKSNSRFEPTDAKLSYRPFLAVTRDPLSCSLSAGQIGLRRAPQPLVDAERRTPAQHFLGVRDVDLQGTAEALRNFGFADERCPRRNNLGGTGSSRAGWPSAIPNLRAIPWSTDPRRRKREKSGLQPPDDRCR